MKNRKMRESDFDFRNPWIYEAYSAIKCQQIGRGRFEKHYKSTCWRGESLPARAIQTSMSQWRELNVSGEFVGINSPNIER